MRVLFLDVDGVLNGGHPHPSTLSWIWTECALELNRVLAEVEPAVVLSSAWRALVVPAVMTERGFEWLLWSHGVRGARVVGKTGTSDDPQVSDALLRPGQIDAWLDAHRAEVAKAAYVDDLQFRTEPRCAGVRTDGSVGLSAADADRLIELLR